MRSAVAVILLSLAFASPAFAEAIEITGRVVQTNVASLPPAGKAGDAFSQRLITRDRNGGVIGDLFIDCRWVTANLRLCTGQLAMPLGSLSLVGASRTRLIGQFAIVGGTGCYIGANGAMTFKATSFRVYTLSSLYTKPGPKCPVLSKRPAPGG